MAQGWWRKPASTRSFMTIFAVGAVASIAALVVGARPLFETARMRRETIAAAQIAPTRDGGGSGAMILVRVVAAAGEAARQRIVATEAPEPLASGERIRIGVRGGTHGFLFAISLDEQGTVTALHPSRGASIPLAPGGPLQVLPHSLELTGEGMERLVVLLSDEPVQPQTVTAAAVAAFRRAGGDLSKLPRLAVPGEQFHRTFRKP